MKNFEEIQNYIHLNYGWKSKLFAAVYFKGYSDGLNSINVKLADEDKIENPYKVGYQHGLKDRKGNMRQKIFQELELAIEEFIAGNKELYDKWALEDDSKAHQEIKDKLLKKFMKITGGSINPSVLGALIGQEFPHCH